MQNGNRFTYSDVTYYIDDSIYAIIKTNNKQEKYLTHNDDDTLHDYYDHNVESYSDLNISDNINDNNILVNLILQNQLTQDVSKFVVSDSNHYSNNITKSSDTQKQAKKSSFHCDVDLRITDLMISLIIVNLKAHY